MKFHFPRILAFLLLALTPTLFHAQEYKYEIGGQAGASIYMGDANRTSLTAGLRPAVGAVFRYNANFRIACKTHLSAGQVTGTTAGSDNVFPFPALTFNRTWMEAGGQVEFNFFPYSDKYTYLNTQRLTPYLLAGLGMTMATGGGDAFTSLHIPLGIGLKYKLRNRFNLGGEFSYRRLFGDSFEGNPSLDAPYGISSSLLKNKDGYTCLLFSLTWDFGLRSNPCNNVQSHSAY